MGQSQNTTEKLINLDTSPTSKVAPPPPPPRTTSDPNYNKNTDNNENTAITAENTAGDTSIPVSVTYFSSGLNGHGLERETIFADDHGAKDAASIVRQHLNPFNPKNPFLDSNGEIVEDKDKSLDDLVEQKIQDLINANPFNSNGSKFNTIGRSNPFSNGSSKNNPFLDPKSNGDSNKMTSSGEDVNDSPDSSLEPDETLLESVTLNKIVSSSRLKTLNLLQILSFCKKQNHFGHDYLAMNFTFHAAKNQGPKYTILDTNW